MDWPYVYYGTPRQNAHLKYSLDGIEVYVPLKLDFTEQITLDYISHFGVKKLVIDFTLK